MHSRSSVPLLLLAGVIAINAGEASAQTPGAGSPVSSQSANRAEDLARVATQSGHEVSVSLGRYTYIEPGALRISIHGTKFGSEYTGTRSLNQRRHWFAQAHVRGSIGTVRYDGWCLPWLITPSSSSRNGYALRLGSASTCSETGDADGYLEVRGLAGKDLFPGNWGVSPATGVAVRYLSNGTTGVAGYRTDAYVYVPLRVTARSSLASHGVMSFNAEYDVLLRGWQTTRQSKLGGGEVPATSTAPAFTIDRFTDLSLPQHRGWALRGGAKYQVTPRWSIEPSYIYWHVSDSEVRYTTVTFTVNGVSAEQQLGAYEPVNVTHEWSVNVGFHF
jgi:hypothetical protein